jgi:hypothetical protein
VTLGGYVKFDMGYATQALGQDLYVAARKSRSGVQNQDDEYGNFYSYAGETRLNMLIKGPDTPGGAKTTAFIEGDFRGSRVASGTTSMASGGTFSLRHAFIKLDWGRYNLTMGQTWQRWGLLPTHAGITLDFNDLGPFLKGLRQPQITFEQILSPNWSYSVGIASPTNTLGNTTSSTSTGTVDNFTRSGLPFFESELIAKTDKCGKIGPWKLMGGLSGFYGKAKPALNVGTAVNPRYTDKNLDAWGLSLKGFIPIIPEKKGNKAGAMGVSAVLFTAQNPSWYQGPLSYGAYQRYTGTTTNEWAAPVITGGWGQFQYFFTDKLFMDFWYGYLRNNFSNRYVSTSVAGTTGNSVQNETQYILNLSYDLNPAVRLGAEYEHINTRYCNGQVTAGGPVFDKKGDVDSFRIGAWYFF